jgi:type I restriction enzyme S subunit
MSNQWPKVRLGEVLTRSEETIALQPDNEYREITVRLWGKGVVLRGIVSGAGIAAQRRYVARSGHFILSRIDARNGALGVVSPELDGAVVTNDFPLFIVDENKLLVSYLGWLCRTESFIDDCLRASEGTTNRVRLQGIKFLAREISLPPLVEQRRIVERIGGLVSQIHKARDLRLQEEQEIQQMLNGVFQRIISGVSRYPMRDVAPQIRRPVQIDHLVSYPELGVRSFGKGTFHKSALTGFEIGSKRVFRIEPGDLIFSNVFAWEGAIAVAKPEDAGRVGSHRFITCVPKPAVATSRFLNFYFLTCNSL